MRCLVGLAALAVGASVAAQAIAPGSFRVGMLCLRTDAADAKERRDAFVAELARQGFKSGTNLQLVESDPGRTDAELASGVAELLRARVQVITTWCGTSAAQAAKRLAGSVPIVFMSVVDPVGSGLVKSLAQPGGNLTGGTSREIDLAVKNIELLKQVIPGLRQLVVLHHVSTPRLPWFESYAAGLRGATQQLGLRIEFDAIDRPAEFEPTIRRLRQDGAVAVLLLGGITNPPGLFDGRDALAERYRIPLVSRIVQLRVRPEALAQRTARQTAHILRGTPAAELPVEQEDQFELVVNRRVARALGIVLPRELLVRATDVID